MAAPDNIEAIQLVAERLGTLTDRVVFLGGATVCLLIADSAATNPRATKDVDVVVDLGSWADYQVHLRKELLSRGFREDAEAGAPICRWVVRDIKVDVMPTDPSILGFSNSWYRTAVAEATTYQLPDGTIIRLVTPPCFLATKLEAFRNRGGDDFVASSDIEDIIAVIDGRATIEEEIAGAANLRAYIAAEIRGLLMKEAFIDSLAGQLAPDEASQARLPLLLARLQRIAAM